MIPILTALVNTFWETVAIAAGLSLILRFARGSNAATRHLLWWTVLAIVVVLPAIPGHTPPVNRPTVIAAAVESDPLPASAPIASPVPGTIAESHTAPVELPAGSWAVGLLIVWCLVSFIQLARTAWSFGYLRRLKHDAKPASADLRRNFDAWMLSCRVHRPVRLLVSPRIQSPMAVGFREPAVILPEALLNQFAADELDHVLLHELAHMARRDDWTNLVARVAGALLWFHPVAAWMLRQIGREREMACDDWVVSMTGAARPYANSLARLFEVCRAGGARPRPAHALASGMATRASLLGDRIQMLLRRNGVFTAKASAGRVALGAVVLLGASLAVAQTPWWIGFDQDAPPAPPAPAAVPARPAAPAPPAPPAAPALEPLDTPPPPPALAAGPPEPPATPPPPAAAPQAPQAPQAPAAPAAAPAPPAPPAGGFLAALTAAGYGNLSVDDIIALRTAGISASFLSGIARSGWGHPSPQQLIELGVHGITPGYAEAMRLAGVRDLTLKEVIELKIHGVRPDKIGEIHAMGFGPYTAKTVAEFAIHGLDPRFFRALKDNGFTGVTPQEIVTARISGLTESDLREARRYGSNLSLQKIVQLKHAGVL